MKYLYSWLKEYYPSIPSIVELDPLLVQLGHDVESIDYVSYEGLITAEILEVARHPDAERLSLTKVNVGDEVLEIVCGAPNLKVGQKVICAKVGSTLPAGITMKPAKIRGIVSHGMLCAADELGIHEDHDGLYSLPDTTPVGEPAHNYLPQDATFSLDITADRGDVLSHFGLARDIAAAHAHTQLQYSFKSLPTSKASSLTIGKIHPDCFALSVAKTDAVEKLPSTPLFMATRLALLGQKSVNLPTDLTNYMMLAFGQPMHAYDASLLGDSIEFTVRRAHDGEKLKALNNKDYILTPQNLVIAANDQSVALAGVMGGDASKINNDTKQVVFECAEFMPKAISLSSRGLNLLTDAALRFERGIDSIARETILHHTLAVWCEITQSTTEAPVSHNQHERQKAVCRVSVNELVSYIGTVFPASFIRAQLEHLGCTIDSVDDTEFTITAPSWRYDLTILEDYAEEIIRLAGFNVLQKKPLSASVPQWKRSRYWRHESIKDTLVALGGYEIETYPFMNTEELALFGIDPSSALELKVAPIKGKTFMRTRLIPASLEAIASNPEAGQLAVFEIGHTYHPEGEKEVLCITVAGTHSPQIDSLWQNLFERFRLPVSSWMARVKTVEQPILDFYKIRKPIVTYFEFPVDEFEIGKSFDIPAVVMPDLDAIDYTPLSKYQTSQRDIAFVVDASYDANDVTQSLTKLDPHIVSVELFDRYTNAVKLGADKQSLAFHLIYQSPEKTLTSQEIDEIHTLVENYVKEKLHGIIR